MSNRSRLGDPEISAALAGLPGWSHERGRLVKRYRFRDFATAWAFMSAAALHVHALDHHPEWSNVYADVAVELVTHDAGGVTDRDVDLARRLESVASAFAAGGA